jgi:hypothetical protein
MKPLSATQRRHLEDAVKSVDALGLTGASAAAQIQHLKVHHGARATQISKGHALAAPAFAPRARGRMAMCCWWAG